MCNKNPNQAPLQEQIQAALEIADQVAEALHVALPQVTACSRQLIHSLVDRLQRAEFFDAVSRSDFTATVAQIEALIARGERREVIVDEHCPEGSYIQTVYTQEAKTLRAQMGPVRQMQRRLDSIYALCMSERLAHQMRTSGDGN